MFLILFAAIAYLASMVVVSVAVWKRVRRKGLSHLAALSIVSGVALLAFLIPFGDHIIGRLYFEHLCSSAAGINIHRMVEKVDGFMWSGQADAPYNDPKTGYVFIEGAMRDGVVTRALVDPSGKVLMQRGVKPQSRYAVEYHTASLAFHVSRGEYVVIERATGERLAQRLAFAHEGGWLFRLQAPLGYRGPSCPSAPFSPRSDLISVVLKPANLEG
jgi:hypothetical protein